METIRAEVPQAGMIILFGSHARGDQVEQACRERIESYAAGDGAASGEARR